MRRMVLLCVLGLALDALDARGETRPRYGGTIEATLLGAPATLDPLAARSHAELTVTGLVFDTLYRLGPDRQLHPHLAAGPPIIDDKRGAVRIVIRKGIRLHDGS